LSCLWYFTLVLFVVLYTCPVCVCPVALFQVLAVDRLFMNRSWTGTWTALASRRWSERGINQLLLLLLLLALTIFGAPDSAGPLPASQVPRHIAVPPDKCHRLNNSPHVPLLSDALIRRPTDDSVCFLASTTLHSFIYPHSSDQWPLPLPQQERAMSTQKVVLVHVSLVVHVVWDLWVGVMAVIQKSWSLPVSAGGPC